jgi:hypothetical protein
MDARSGRDALPRSSAGREQRGCPQRYVIRDPAPGLLHVHTLFLPPDIDAALDRLHRDYIAWWIAKDNPAWRRFPSRGIAVCPSHDFVRVTVLREHADWCRGLFGPILPLSYSPWRLRTEAEAWAVRQLQAIVVGGDAI